MNITKKEAATDSYQSQQDDEQFPLDCFSNCQPPLGIRDVPRFKLIDLDEFEVTLEKINCTGGGCSLKIFCVKKDGHYHHGAKTTYLLSIKHGDPRGPLATHGSIENPLR